ncbi:uncharacterized protein LOC128999060 [Macrosteles quadrilineatus]|uniref:uncharacterized protein LOC128999060 n=1 Tax=Macrosteles quadrilineatus TaxID=74068 RepID=UPI0023E0B83C|nr:uncharacterized protein LOC128999060 [Macrosteles quadrilineatus]
MRCVARWLALCALVVVIKEISSSVQPEDDIQPEQTQQIQLSKCPYCHQCTDSCYEGPLRNAFRFKGRQYYIPNPNLARICPRRKDRNGGIVPCIRPCPGVDEIGCNEDQSKININGQAEIFAQARSSDNHFSPNDPVANNHEATTNSDCDLTDLEKSFSLIRNDNLGNARGNVEDHKHKTDSTIDYSFTGSGHSSNSGLIENVNEDQNKVRI